MKTPPWLAQEASALGVKILGGKMSRADADAAIVAAARSHPEYGEELAAASAVRVLGKWLGEHTASGDLFQTQMFPDLPAVMRVAPQKSARVADMTAEDLDHARNMLLARTSNMVAGAEEAAERERSAFFRLYDRVRPLLSGDLTVGDVLGKLAAKENAA